MSQECLSTSQLNFEYGFALALVMQHAVVRFHGECMGCKYQYAIHFLMVLECRGVKCKICMGIADILCGNGPHWFHNYDILHRLEHWVAEMWEIDEEICRCSEVAY